MADLNLRDLPDLSILDDAKGLRIGEVSPLEHKVIDRVIVVLKDGAALDRDSILQLHQFAEAAAVAAERMPGV